jgi:hypothetical protein
VTIQPLALAAAIVADGCQQNQVQTDSNNGLTDENALLLEHISAELNLGFSILLE